MSIEVDPRLAHDTAKTVEEAKALAAAVDRPNVLIKIPATVEGLPAITEVLGAGHQRQRHADLLARPLPRRHERLPHRPRAGPRGGHDLSDDPLGRLVLRLPRRHRDRQAARRASAPTRPRRCGARPASPTPGWPTRPTRRSSRPRAGRCSTDDGAHEQRPLWASTGVKDPAYPDTMYVTELVAPTPSTPCPRRPSRPSPTTARSAATPSRGYYAEAAEVLDSLERLGVSYADVVALLEREGVDKFEKSWGELLDGGRPRELEKGTRVSALDVVAAGAAADAIAAHVPALVADRVASRLFAQDATLWGPSGRGRVGQPAVVDRAAPLLAPPGRRGRGAARRPAPRPGSTTSCSAAWAGRRWRPRSSAPRPACRSWCSTPPTPTTCAAP